MSTDEHAHERPGFPPAQGRPARSDTEPPPDAQVGFGDDAAGAVGSAAPLEDDVRPADDDFAARREADDPAG